MFELVERLLRGLRRPGADQVAAADRELESGLVCGENAGAAGPFHQLGVTDRRPDSLAAGGREEVGYATPEDPAAPSRVADADSAWVSAPKGFRIEPEQVGPGGSG